MKHLLLVESNESVTGIKHSKELGYTITLLTQNVQHYLKGAPLETHPLQMVDYMYEVQTNNEQAVVDFVTTYHQERSLDGVMSFSEFYVIQATAAAKAIGVPTMSPEATKQARNKYRSRQLCVQHNVPVPQSIEANSWDEVCAAVEKVGYPCIFKPCDGAMSVGVVHVTNQAELRQAYDFYLQNRYFGRDLYGSETVLIEEYAQGPLVSVETVMDEGECHVLGICDRSLVGFPFFVECGTHFPVHLPNQDEVIDVVLRGLKAVGVDFGPCHTEVALTKEGPKIIEINPRMAGGPVPEMILHATGIDFTREVLRMHMGEKPHLQATQPLRAVAARLLYAPVTGLLEAVEGLEEVKQRPDVVSFTLTGIGKEVRMPESNFDSIGKVLVVGETVEDAQEKLREVRSTLKLKIVTEGRG